MSLILEALRKSEAERQIGRAPGLLTPMPLAGTEPSRRRWWLVGLLITLVAGAIALAWWLGRNGQSEASQTVSTAAAGAAAPASNLAPADPATPSEAQTAPATASPAAAPPPLTRPLPAAGPADFPSDPDFESTERESLPLPAPVSAPPSVPSAPFTAAPVTAAATTTVPTPVAPSEPELPPVPPMATAPPDVPATTQLSALSEAERAGLPPLRLSMHVFNAEPSRRFVMIDGKRHAEGEPLAAEVKLVEIRREGAVVDIRGRLVLIERP